MSLDIQILTQFLYKSVWKILQTYDGIIHLSQRLFDFSNQIFGWRIGHKIVFLNSVFDDDSYFIDLYLMGLNFDEVQVKAHILKAGNLTNNHTVFMNILWRSREKSQITSVNAGDILVL